MKKYKTDVSMWRAAGVSTKISGNEHPNCCVATPEQYVAAAFKKCNSGAHSAFFTHELMHLIVSNMKDLTHRLPTWLFFQLFSAHAQRMKGINKKLAKSQTTVAPASDDGQEK